MPRSGKTDEFGIWYTQPSKWADNFPDGWVTDESYRVALYATERAAKRDIKNFVHAEHYEVRRYDGS